MFRYASILFYFMHHILLKFGLCYLIILDDGISFKGAFIAMCEALHSNHGIFAKRNHKSITAEHSQRFLYKSVAIAAEERGTNDSFVPASVPSGYAWNSAPIDGTDILCSIPAICRGLQFLLYVNLNTFPKLMQNNGQAALNYLKLTDYSRHFFTSTVKYLLRIVALLMPSASKIIEILLL